MTKKLNAFIKVGALIDLSSAIPTHSDLLWTPAIEANARYFNNPQWTTEYLNACHRSRAFKERWTAATGSWDGKVVVDIGCGPGNVFATLGGKPKMLIGVDVSAKSLEIAREAAYEVLLADAHDLPLASGIADIVVLNATLHHCDDMPAVLREAARLVAPDGVLVTDHDPQLSAWNFKGPGMFLWQLRLPVYRGLGIGFHRSSNSRLAHSQRKFITVRGMVLQPNSSKECPPHWASNSKHSHIIITSGKTLCRTTGAAANSNIGLDSFFRA